MLFGSAIFFVAENPTNVRQPATSRNSAQIIVPAMDAPRFSFGFLQIPIIPHSSPMTSSGMLMKFMIPKNGIKPNSAKNVPMIHQMMLPIANLLKM